ncbi:MAG: hypothetical protein VX768_21120 [Planctomycetota bacterium]|nr:hypothetical protein [Planctomycetota bacterium]
MKKLLWIIGGSIGGVLSLVVLVVLFRSIYTSGMEIKEEKDAERAAAIARENSPEAKAKRKAFVQSLMDDPNKQSGVSASGSSGSGTVSSPPPRQLTNAQVTQMIARKCPGRLREILEQEKKSGQLKGNLKTQPLIDGAWYQLEKFALQPSLNEKDVREVARLVREIDFGEGWLRRK